MSELIDFRTSPDVYRHWRLGVDGPTATLTMQVDPDGGLRGDYELKLNSYDLGVDIELYDAVQRLRFEHPEVRAVVVTSGLDKVFCSGANIQMLAGSTHAHKVNFCKFTNETRNSIEDATAHSGQVWIAAVNGTAAGGGYELALACDEIVLVDDRSSTRLAAGDTAAGGAARHGWPDTRRRQAPRAARSRRRLRHTRRGSEGPPSGRVEARRLHRAAQHVHRARRRTGHRPRRRVGSSARRRRNRTRPSGAFDRRRHDLVSQRRRVDRPRARRSPHHGPLADDTAADHAGRAGRGRQRRLDHRRRPRARRRDVAPAVQRDRGRNLGDSQRRRHRRGDRRRVAAGDTRRRPTTGSCARFRCTGPGR